MRSLSILCLVLFISEVSPCQSASQSSPSPLAPHKENATVAGNVFRLDSGQPLKKATVSLQSHGDGTFSVFYLTDEQGYFLFENVPPGPYDLQVSRNGYVDASYGQKKLGAPGAMLTLSSGQQITDLVFKLAHAAAISGHVYDEDGEPIAKAAVKIYRAANQQAKVKEEGDEPILTNDLGEFRIFALPPGRYYVAVSYRREDPFQRDTPAPNQRVYTGYLPGYYPNTSDPTKAQPISVGPGDEIRSVDFLLRSSRLVTVRGRVVCATPDGSAESGRVSLNPQGKGLAQIIQGLYGNFDLKDGKFEIWNVPPGAYDLTASYRGGDPNVWHIARRQLEVGNSDVDGANLTIFPGTDIAGRITWGGAAAIASVSADLHVGLHALGENQVYFSEATIKPDGTFQLKSVPEGVYRPVVHLYGPQENFFLKSARYGSAVVADAGFTVQPGADASLDLTLNSRVARLSGFVLNNDSLPSAGAIVVLIPDPPHRGIFEQYKSANTDQNGKFSMAGLTPGDYKLFSWDSAEESDDQYGEDWFDAEWLKGYESKGKFVHLEEGDQKSVSLKLIEMETNSP